MAWTNLTYAFGSKLTSTQMTQNQANFASMAAKESGAPVLAAGYVTRSILSAGTLASNTYTATSDIASSFGTYAFQMGFANPNANWSLVPYVASTYATGFRATAGTGTLYVQDRGVNASAPYDLGYGTIPFFVYLQLDPSGKIISTAAAEVTPWYYTGPHQPTCHNTAHRDGKEYRSCPRLLAEHRTIAEALKAGFSPKLIATRLREDELHEVLVSPEDKNIDMHLRPHPFDLSLRPNDKVVLINPASQIVLDLLEIHNSPDFISVSDILSGGYLTIDNAIAQAITPPGVLTVSARWKST